MDCKRFFCVRSFLCVVSPAELLASFAIHIEAGGH